MVFGYDTKPLVSKIHPASNISLTQRIKRVQFLESLLRVSRCLRVCELLVSTVVLVTSFYLSFQTTQPAIYISAGSSLLTVVLLLFLQLVRVLYVRSIVVSTAVARNFVFSRTELLVTATLTIVWTLVAASMTAYMVGNKFLCTATDGTCTLTSLTTAISWVECLLSLASCWLVARLWAEDARTYILRGDLFPPLPQSFDEILSYYTEPKKREVPSLILPHDMINITAPPPYRSRTPSPIFPSSVYSTPSRTSSQSELSSYNPMRIECDTPLARQLPAYLPEIGHMRLSIDLDFNQRV
ncbi:uncharacterized protein VTP21DRAFT_7353 [Calcarisporiella thermophila]|uniref:uncharacterized protein n=1 Tax=Calcarisporiella thermophila TaxID=911321 RepID=UPI0037421317